MDLAAHEAALARLREEMEKEKEAAVESAKMMLEEQFSLAQQEQLLKHEELRKEERRRIEAEKQVCYTLENGTIVFFTRNTVSDIVRIT